MGFQNVQECPGVRAEKCPLTILFKIITRMKLLFSNYFQGRKRNPNLNFLVRMFSGGVGVFHVKGWGPKSSACPSKPGKPNLFGGISRDFAGISRRCPKSLRRKSLCSISVLYILKNWCFGALLFWYSFGFLQAMLEACQRHLIMAVGSLFPSDFTYLPQINIGRDKLWKRVLVMRWVCQACPGLVTCLPSHRPLPPHGQTH